MNTPEILSKAADVIEERGWFQGASVDPLGGGGVCAMGAMRVARGLPPLPMDGDYATADEEVDTAAEVFYDRWLSRCYDDVGDVIDWNDEHGRTADEVTAALRECAAELSKETSR